MRVWLALRCFFKLLFNAEFARRVQQLTERGLGPPESNKPLPTTTSATSAELTPSPARPPSSRSDAITLLATLQREARFVDIVSEPLESYSDAQIGAAARDVLRDSGKVLNRLFKLKRVVDTDEGEQVEVPASYDTGKYRLTGNVSGEPPLVGELMHAGWEATACDLPTWTGGEQAAFVIAPAEVQIS
jgi:hypothetical protein